MRRAQGWIIRSAVLALALVVLIPPWQQKYKGTRLSYKGQLGRHLLWAPPKATGEQSWMVNAPASQCEVALEPEAMLWQSVMIIAAAVILLLVFRPRPFAKPSESGDRPARLGWRRIVTALGAGFSIELSLISIVYGSGDPSNSRSAEWVLKWTQEPGSRAAAFLITSLRLGFEEGMGWYLLVFPVIQGIAYGLAIYVAFVILLKRRAPAREQL